ncbi:GNAT family N-acetyltransferase [Desulfopila sp. IMCC35008]|uniref:GNAT family N-acetyltransferase n=1 Tax=Desulfopila sp. IMCC35008 TaxID=2653858 RepID=UPI0013D6BCB2|nr:N-acetyltransferase [Desulfopila sp. IMCC35008]
MEVRKAINTDFAEILDVHKAAFGEKKGPEIAQLVDDLFTDISASPSLSLVAVEKGVIVGHILYTKVTLQGASQGLSCQILAPLAVLPDVQGKGIGRKLIEAGLRELKMGDVQLVFVLGHPGYYPRCGFIPAGELGFEAPYPIPEEHAGAWMVQELFPGNIGSLKGQVQCCHALNKPEHWRE